jgi:hypothetical protein
VQHAAFGVQQLFAEAFAEALAEAFADLLDFVTEDFTFALVVLWSLQQAAPSLQHAAPSLQQSAETDAPPAAIAL